MRATIEVANRAEGSAIKAGLEDPTVRAFAVCVGVLRGLPTDRARRRVLDFVSDALAEANGATEE